LGASDLGVGQAIGAKDSIVRKTMLLTVFVALAAISGCKNEPARRPASPIQPSGPRSDEYYVWEKTSSKQFKQVKKDYFLNKELCRNVIDVLNNMSTQQPRSSWALSHTTDSTFECWPASVDPNDYYKKNSTYSDSPAVTSPAKPRPDEPARRPAPN
jgi:hypothetical protein